MAHCLTSCRAFHYKMLCRKGSAISSAETSPDINSWLMTAGGLFSSPAGGIDPNFVHSPTQIYGIHTLYASAVGWCWRLVCSSGSKIKTTQRYIGWIIPTGIRARKQCREYGTCDDKAAFTPGMTARFAVCYSH